MGSACGQLGCGERAKHPKSKVYCALEVVHRGASESNVIWWKIEGV
jgi:hypothetical protein